MESACYAGPFYEAVKMQQIEEQVLRPPAGSSIGAHREADSADIKTEQTWKVGEETRGFTEKGPEIPMFHS